MQPERTARIPLRGRDGVIKAYAVIDESDLALAAQGRWWLQNRGYVQGHLGKGRHVLLHRFLLDLPPELTVDHINRDKLDNRRVNLRIASLAENNQNRDRRRGSSKYRGVHRIRDRWRAYGTLAGKRQHIGYFMDENEAGRAAAEWRREHMPFSEDAMKT